MVRSLEGLLGGGVNRHDEPHRRALVVVVEGHTDSIGSDAYNMKLSQRRAATVRDYMVENGISPSRIKTEAFGKTKPIASNKTAAGRAQNRRVDIVAQ